MNHGIARKLTSVAIVSMFAVSCCIVVAAQYSSNSKPNTSAVQQGTPTLTAKLIDPEKKAQQKAATVEVKVSGIKIVDPATANEKPKAGEGHLHYQVDDGPVIATTTMKLSFHGLAPGAHKIVVTLAGNDHNPLGPQETLNVTVP